MKFDIQKLDAHIKKLQEIRRLATDPETASMLLEFINSPSDASDSAPAGNERPGAARTSTDAADLAKEVVNGKEAGFGSGLWTRGRS